MISSNIERLKFKKDVPFMWDGFAWRKARKITCEDCKTQWWIRIDRKGQYRYCDKCRRIGERNPGYGKVSPFKGTGLGDVLARHKKLERRKFWAFKYKGGKCSVCGVSELPLACFHFHHLRDKKYHISHVFQNKNWKETLISELDKCILVCANCHITIHHKK